MTLYRGQRVNTPKGPGIVNYWRMAAPNYTEMEVVSVRLEHREQDIGYEGTIFPINQVTPMED